MQRKDFKRVALILLVIFVFSASFSSFAMVSTNYYGNAYKQYVEQMKRARIDEINAQKERDRLAKIEADRQAELKAERDRLAKIEADRQAELKAERDRLAKLEAQRQAELRAKAELSTEELLKIERDKLLQKQIEERKESLDNDSTLVMKKFSELTTDEKDQILNEKFESNEIPTFVVVGGEKYFLNESLWQEKGIIAYGNSEEISKNENSTTYEAIKDGIARYFGYDINGNIYTNSEFRNDVGSSNNSQNKNWVTLDEMKGNKGAADLIHYDFLDKDKFSRKKKMNTAEKFLEQNSDWVSAGWTAKKIVATFKFSQVTDDSGLTQGSFVGTHKTSTGKVYYDTFTVKRGDPSYVIKTNNGKKEEDVEVVEVKEVEVVEDEKTVYKATIIVQGKNKITGDLLYSKDYKYNIKKGQSKTIVCSARELDGYVIVGLKEKTVTITPANLNQTIIFEYDFLPVQHEDQHSYHTDIDVITSVIVKALDGNITNDNKAYVHFYVDGNFIGTKELVQPNGASQLAYMKWRTPAYATNLEMTVIITGNKSARIVGGADEIYGAGNYSLREITIPIEIINLYEHTPPNPEANDKPEDHDYFHQP